MAGAESYVRVPADSTGKKMRTVKETIGTDEVHNEGVVIVDPTTTTQVMGVNSSGNATVKVNEALPAGTNAIGKLAANSGVDIGDVDVTSIAAGSNIIGKVGIDQTTPGTTNRVDIGAALPAGTNAIGKLAANSGVDIGDVDVASIAAGSNIIGKVGIDQTTPGTTNRVDIGAALPAGTNAIGKLAANSGVDIGDVDVTSVVPGTGATNLGKAEDAAHTSGDVGVQILGVRNDTPTSRVGADGDYTPIAVDEFGHVKIIVVNNAISATAWKYADINDASSGDNTIIAAQGAGNKIAVWSVLVVSDGTVDVRFEDGAGGTAFTGQIPLQAREGFAYNGGTVPLWVGSANTLLNLELSAAVNVHGHVSYTVVK